MGSEEHILESFFAKKEYFADAVNGLLFQGKQIVRPEELEQISGNYKTSSVRGKAVARRRDVVMKSAWGTRYAIVGLENQSAVHYSMPIRNMEYDLLEYKRQLDELKQEYGRREGLASGGEFLSGLRKTDKILPVITIVLYYGEEKWDGPVSISDMVQVPGQEREVFKQLFQDYKINLLWAYGIEHTEYFRTALRQVFRFLPHSKSGAQMKHFLEENRTEYQQLPEEVLEVLGEFAGAKKTFQRMIQKSKVGGKIDMCRGLEELLDESHSEGWNAGRNEGLNEGIVAIIRRKVNKGMDAAAIAEALELEGAYVEKVVDLIAGDSGRTDWQIAELLMPDGKEKITN